MSKLRLAWSTWLHPQVRFAEDPLASGTHVFVKGVTSRQLQLFTSLSTSADIVSQALAQRVNGPAPMLKWGDHYLNGPLCSYRVRSGDTIETSLGLRGGMQGSPEEQQPPPVTMDGALRRLAKRGVRLEREIYSELEELPHQLQQLALELTAYMCSAPDTCRAPNACRCLICAPDTCRCPICKPDRQPCCLTPVNSSLMPVNLINRFDGHSGDPGNTSNGQVDIARNIIRHFLDHHRDSELSCNVCNDKCVGSVTSTLARGPLLPFAVSASMLGTYFDLHQCDRFLHHKSLRLEGGGRKVDLGSLINPLQKAHTQRGYSFEDTIDTQLVSEGLATGWDKYSSTDPSAAAAAAAAAATSGHRIQFIKCGLDFSGDISLGQGVLIDLKVEAQRQCGCAMCATAIRQEQVFAGSCRLYQEYKKVSEAALLAEHRHPTMLYQLELRAPVDKEQVSSFWSLLRGDAEPCAMSDNVHAGGEPVAVSLSRGYLDYLLLMPEGWPEEPVTGAPLTATVIDAKATTRVKVRARAAHPSLASMG